MVYLNSIENASRAATRGRVRSSGTLTQAKLRMVESYVQERLAETITLQEMARVACYSPSRFLQLFRNSTGFSPYQYVMTKRLEKARNLILTTNQKLAAIALDCGFADQSHLIRLFKKHMGITPSKMRQKVVCAGDK